MKIVFSNDFLFHGQEESPLVFHGEVFSLLSVVIEDVCGIKPVSISECTDSSGRKFSRKEFFSFSGVNNPAPSYYLYDVDKISQASWDYFASFFDAGTLFVASEFGLDLREKLTQLGITYVNFWFHPFKLLNDSFFLIGTNSPKLFAQLEKFKVSRAKMRLYGEYYTQLARRRHFTDNLPIEDGCCLFVGQTYRDKSIAAGGTYLNITNYPEKIEELAAKYSKIYYVPHPAAEPNPEVEAFIEARPDVEILKGVPTYYLLASPKIRKVVALSSSVLYEAEFFGKEVEYLFRPLFKIDEAFSLNTFVSVYQDYFGPKFWRAILAAHEGRDVDDDCDLTPGDSMLARDSDMFRELVQNAFGYRFLGRQDRDEIRVDALEAQFNQKIAQLSEAMNASSQSNAKQFKEHGEMIAILRESLEVAHSALREAHARLNAMSAELEAIRASRSYKLGRLLTAVPRKLLRHSPR